MIGAWLASAADRAIAATVIRPTLQARPRWSMATSRELHARRFFHPAPAVSGIILIHGYLGGNHMVESRAWPVRRWFAQGHDIAMLTLPFHGARKERGAIENQCLTSEGLRQAIEDLSTLIDQLRTRGIQRIAVMGMSLGGYLASLLATLDGTLALVVPIVPLADLRDFAGTTRPWTEGPLDRRPLIAPERVLVIGAEQDRIAPLSHARALARHFDARLVTMRGGHVVQLGRSSAFDEVERRLAS